MRDLQPSVTQHSSHAKRVPSTTAGPLPATSLSHMPSCWSVNYGSYLHRCLIPTTRYLPLLTSFDETCRQSNGMSTTCWIIYMRLYNLHSNIWFCPFRNFYALGVWFSWKYTRRLSLTASVRLCHVQSVGRQLEMEEEHGNPCYAFGPHHTVVDSSNCH